MIRRMRGSLLALLLAACASSQGTREATTLLRKAAEAREIPDWPVVRLALEEAALLDPDDPEVRLLLAETLLEAYAEIDRARALYWGLRETSRARALHGLGRCALWDGDEDRALALFEESLVVGPTAACARDLAVRRLARGDDAGPALDAVERISRGTLRSRLLLAAAGRAPRPERLPQEWHYGLERARLAPPEQARTEVEAYVAEAAATFAARDRLREVLAGDFALRRNPAPRSEVRTDSVPERTPR